MNIVDDYAVVFDKMIYVIEYESGDVYRLPTHFYGNWTFVTSIGRNLNETQSVIQTPIVLKGSKFGC